MDENPAQADSVESQSEHAGGGGFPWYAWLLVLVLVVYPLSIGPAARLHRAYPGARPTIEAIYQPVVFLNRHSRLAGKFFEWYVVVVWKVN